MNIVVCDYQKDYLNAIEKRVGNFFKNGEFEYRLYMFASSCDMYQSLLTVKYDLAYIEMSMDDGDGIEIAKNILKHSPECMIIFISHKSDRIEEALQLNAFQYIYKPFDSKVFQSELSRAVENYRQKDHKFFLHTSKGKNVIFKVNEIVYVETYYYDLEIVTVERRYRCDVKQKYRLRPILKQRYFLQVNQSILVNMDFIDVLTDRCVVLKTREVFNVSYRHTAKIQSIYQMYLLNRMGKDVMIYENSNY